MVSLMIPSAHLLSTMMGVAGCLWLRKSSATRKGQLVWALVNAAPVSASAADDCTCRMMPVATWMGPLIGVGAVFVGRLDKKMNPASRDRALGADR